MREKEDTLKAASYIARLIYASTETEHKNIALFELLLRTLALLKDGADPRSVEKIFEIKLTDVEGFFPKLDGCVKCKRPVKKEPEEATFNLVLGGLTCTSCSKAITGGTTAPFKLFKEIVKIKSSPFEELKNITFDKNEIERLNLLLRPYISDHIGKDIRNW